MSSAAPTTADPTSTESVDDRPQHGARAHTDGGWGLVPVQTRSERFRSTDPAAFAEVTGREVDWKLSPVGRLRPLIDGPLDGSPYAFLARETAGASVDWADASDPLVGRAGTPEDKASANAWASTEKVLVRKQKNIYN